jgi:hypothetical protein
MVQTSEVRIGHDAANGLNSTQRKRVDAERKRLEEEADAAKEWRLKIDEARNKGEQYADKSEFKWSLSEIDNLMTDDKVRWARLSEQFFRVDKWSVCRG